MVVNSSEKPLLKKSCYHEETKKECEEKTVMNIHDFSLHESTDPYTRDDYE